MDRNVERDLIRQGRLTAIVIAGSVLLWLIANWVGPRLELDLRYAILTDLIVLALLFWSLIKCFLIWRKRQINRG